MTSDQIAPDHSLDSDDRQTLACLAMVVGLFLAAAWLVC